MRDVEAFGGPDTGGALQGTPDCRQAQCPGTELGSGPGLGPRAPEYWVAMHAAPRLFCYTTHKS
jgi:hypothetical protein